MDINTGQLQGQPVLGQNGEKIGTAENVYLDNQTNRPEWVEVKTGLFGTKSALVPLADAQPDPAGGIRLPYDKARIKAAPHHDPDSQLSETEEAELFSYYDLPYTGATGTADTDRAAFAPAPHAGTAGYDTSGPNTDDAMTRSEERLQVGTQSVEVGRARLRKYLVTEQVHADGAGDPRRGAGRARAHHRGEPRRRPQRARPVRRGARSSPHSRAAGRREGDRAGRAGPPRHPNGHRRGAGQRDRPPGKD